jgi:hypothetical protein
MTEQEYELREPCFIETFVVDGEEYRLDMFPLERRQREVVHVATLETVLVFPVNGSVMDKHGKLGDIHIENGEWVYYQGPIRTRHRFETNNLGKVEVAIAKMYLEPKHD